jgi:hypothetical protein
MIFIPQQKASHFQTYSKLIQDKFVELETKKNKFKEIIIPAK